MKNNIMRLMMAAVLCAGLTFAQGGGKRAGGRFAEQLGLSEDQKPQVQTIMKEQREAMQTARKNNASKDDMKAIHQKTHDRLASVLNADQMQKFEAGAKKMKQRRKPQA
ncbi:MAG: hypothetical protein ABIQ44_16330 [Chloroflexia bacterium]